MHSRKSSSISSPFSGGSVSQRADVFLPDFEWLRARRDLLKKTKAEVQARLGPEPCDVRKYAERYEKELRNPWKISDKAQLLEAIADANVVYGGDFHALGQAQRTHLKILRALPGTRLVTLALECFTVSSQKWIDAFLTNKISAGELYEKAGWEENWGFPWENYRPLLELARRRGWRVLALNQKKGERAKGSLKSRETTAARVIANFRARNPANLVYVIFGDLHLAEPHLPLQVRLASAARHRRFGGERKNRNTIRALTIHLNSERIYFQLARKGLEHTTDVVRFRSGDFCVSAVPPWVQWQSYLFFLERTLDLDLNSLGSEQNDYDEIELDPTDQVAVLARMAAADLGYVLKIDDLEVFASSDKRIWERLESRLALGELKLARELCTLGRSFFLPNKSGNGGIGILGRSTVNHAASLAGHYLFAKLAGLRSPLWKLPATFEALTWGEATAYFVSKLINHKRQSETLLDLRAQLLKQGPTEVDKDVLKIALDRVMSELVFVASKRLRRVRYEPRRKASYLEAARIVGGMMGERLYIAYRSRKMKKGELVRLVRRNPMSANFRAEYLRLVKKLADLVGTDNGKRSLSPSSRLGMKSRPDRL